MGKTPKEKAKELVDSFIEIMPPLHNQTGKTIMDHAIKCALIAVDEIIKNSHISGVVEYWKEVKQELLNTKTK